MSYHRGLRLLGILTLKGCLLQIGRLWRAMDNGGLKDLPIPATQADEMDSVGGSELIVLGSGSSTGVPSPLCLINPTDPPCHVCHMAMEGPHELNRNYR
jgi:hypothetical protein